MVRHKQKARQVGVHKRTPFRIPDVLHIRYLKKCLVIHNHKEVDSLYEKVDSLICYGEEKGIG